MVLKYFHGKNFGDALNPLIFNHLIPDSLDNNADIEFFGIGSLIGIDELYNSKARKKIIFSSGYGEYGPIPKLDETHDIVCVRGPLTAKALNIDQKLAVTDGAILLKFLNFPERSKKHEFSYMPHWDSERRFNWADFCQKADINYISPTKDIHQIIEDILETKVLITEAMHGAIVADTLRVPWIPVKAYKYIREFKWLDWASSMHVPYQPNYINSLYDSAEERSKYYKIVTKSLLPDFAYSLAAHSFVKLNKEIFNETASRKFRELKSAPVYLSKESVWKAKGDEMLEKLEKTMAFYKK